MHVRRVEEREERKEGTRTDVRDGQSEMEEGEDKCVQWRECM